MKKTLLAKKTDVQQQQRKIDQLNKELTALITYINIMEENGSDGRKRVMLTNDLHMEKDRLRDKINEEVAMLKRISDEFDSMKTVRRQIFPSFSHNLLSLLSGTW